jgi:hypothetical protein
LYEGVEWGELYDLANDPDELNNLWDVSDAFNYRNDLTERLTRKMMQLAETSPLATHHGP